MKKIEREAGFQDLVYLDFFASRSRLELAEDNFKYAVVVACLRAVRVDSGGELYFFVVFACWCIDLDA